MFQLFLILIKLVLGLLFTAAAITCAVISVRRWRGKRPFYLLSGLAVLAALLAYGVWSYSLTSAESTDRTELVEAFHSNFGFYPPESVKEIKVKNVFIYDASGHWMAFTYDPAVFDRVMAHDQPLQIADAGTREFDTIIKDAYLKNQNRPDWAGTPDGRASRIFFKKDFLDHTFSEYYLWVDSTEAMVHLHVSYFD
ncbi:MAG: hypothetical protein JNL43_11800 [Flavobacteriales bacterium]|nr:hypothetical protein [Flavobacteriales bacterium]